MSQKIADAVNDFGELAARQVTLHEWRVLSWRNGTLTAHKVDVRDLDCTCADTEYNQTGGNEVCDHVAKALYQAKAQQDVGDAIAHDMHRKMIDLDSHVEAIERRAAGVSADANPDTTNTSENAQTDARTPSMSDSELKDAFVDAVQESDVPVGKLKWWIHDDHGSLNAETDGYLEDGEFAAWQDLQDELDMKYDGDEDCSFIQRKDAEEVLG